MKIGIISDTHGDAKAWEQAYNNYFHDADRILHAGDFLYHGPRNPMADGYGPAKLAQMINECEVPIVAAFGNCDSFVDTSVLDIPLADPYAFIEIDGRRIVVTHGHICESDAEKDALAKKLKADIFVSGHTHIGGIEKRGDTIFINPGSPSLSKRQDSRQTVALMENGEIKVMDLFTGETLDTMKC